MTIYYLHSRLCLLTALIEYLIVLLKYLDLFANWVVGHSKHLGTSGPCQACILATPLIETTVSCVSHVSVILVSDYFCFMLVHSLYSGIILAKIVIYCS